jgi:hypothetical protein
MGDVAIIIVILFTVAVLLAQLAGFARPPRRPSAVALRMLILLVWGAAAFLALVGLIAFNYCEAHCPSDINLPTAGILLAMSALDALASWLALRVIPRWGSRPV